LILFFGRMIDGLDPTFSGRFICCGIVGPLREG
jgi:hypothetical protein